MPKITTFLTFVDQAEQAATLYTSIFDGKILSVTRYGEGAPAPAGSVMTVEFELEGHRYVALNGGDHFKFTDAFSLSIECDTQKEIDAYTEKLIAGGGKQGPCGWVTDRFGVSWQVNPKILPKLLGDKDPAKARRAMEAMLKMTKLDIAELQRAHAGA
jgi:predicted 3-demethylubiquinone-9 3-methyltransferase (glyoxalase superfamily)